MTPVICCTCGRDLVGHRAYVLGGGVWCAYCPAPLAARLLAHTPPEDPATPPGQTPGAP